MFIALSLSLSSPLPLPPPFSRVCVCVCVCMCVCARMLRACVHMCMLELSIKLVTPILFYV